MFTVWSVEEEERRGRLGWRETCQQRSRWPERVEMSVRLIGGDVVSIGNSSVFKKSPRSLVALLQKFTQSRGNTSPSWLPCCRSNATQTKPDKKVTLGISPRLALARNHGETR